MTEPDPGVVLMWEVRTADGRLDDLLGWLQQHADPTAEVFLSREQGRVVVIAANLDSIAAIPAELLARPAQQWPFSRVER